MAKARMYGQKNTFIPNNKADMRFIKKLSRNREQQQLELRGKPIEQRKRVGV
jgi:hypothetical protein